MDRGYNTRSPAVKRLMKEAQELREPTEQYFAQPLEDNLFEWHFTVRGPPDSPFQGGFYHGRIILPTEYPMKPPSIIMLTPNGRFEINKKICLSISGHHPESWQPSWSIRTALLAIIGFMPTEGMGAIGSLDYPEEERKKLAVKSVQWSCPSCGLICNLLKKPAEGTEAQEEDTDAHREAKELAKQICFNATAKSSSSLDTSSSNTSTTTTDPSPTTSPSDSSSHSPHTSERGELRQRIVENETPNVIPASNPQGPTLASNQGGQWSNYLVAMLVAAIAALLFRRLFLM